MHSIDHDVARQRDEREYRALLAELEVLRNRRARVLREDDRLGALTGLPAVRSGTPLS